MLYRQNRRNHSEKNLPSVRCSNGLCVRRITSFPFSDWMWERKKEIDRLRERERERKREKDREWKKILQDSTTTTRTKQKRTLLVLLLFFVYLDVVPSKKSTVGRGSKHRTVYFTKGFLKWAIPDLFVIYFRSFSIKHQYNFYNKLMWKNVHLVYSVGIRTHNPQITNLLP